MLLTILLPTTAGPIFSNDGQTWAATIGDKLIVLIVRDSGGYRWQLRKRGHGHIEAQAAISSASPSEVQAAGERALEMHRSARDQ